MPPRPLRVYYLDHCARLSGAEIALARLLPGLMTDVTPLVLLGEDGPLVERLRDLDIPVEVLPLDPRVRDLRKDTLVSAGFDLRAALRIVPYVFALTRRLRADKPDLVHTNSMKAALYGGVAARLAGVPMVWHLRDRVAPDYLPQAAVRLVRLAARLLPAVIVANSASTLSTVPERTNGVVVDNVVIHDGISGSAVAPREGRDLVFAVLGRLSPWKGQHIFLEAFARAFRDSEVRGRLIGSAMFGEEDYEAQLQRMVSELGLRERIEFRGFREKVFDELSEIDVLVHCSTTPEPFGQVVVEGMTSGLAVIAADEGGPAEVVHDGVDGLLVPPRRADLLAEAMTRLAGDEGLRRELGAAARQSARRFSAEHTAEQVLAVYARVLDKQMPEQTP